MDKLARVLRRKVYEIAGALAGVVGGYLYWRYVGCASGTCPISANWYTMVPYGVLIGILLGSFFSNKRAKSDE